MSNRKAVQPKRAMKPPRQQDATFVSGKGTDADIAARCAEHVEGWTDLSAKNQADMVRLMREFENLPPPPRMSVRVDEGSNTFLGTPEDANVSLNALRLTDTMASFSADYINDRISDLTSFARSGPKGGLKPKSESLSAALAFVAGGKPTDTVQSTLLVQMAATHDAAMRALGAAARMNYIEHAKVWGNISAKLLNAYTRQAEVLAKLQRGGVQTVKLIHIDNRGGQAVVTEQVIAGGGVNAESQKQACGLDALGPALLGSDPFGRVVPMSSDSRAEALPPSRMCPGKRIADGQ